MTTQARTPRHPDRVLLLPARRGSPPLDPSPPVRTSASPQQRSIGQDVSSRADTAARMPELSRVTRLVPASPPAVVAHRHPGARLARRPVHGRGRVDSGPPVARRPRPPAHNRLPLGHTTPAAGARCREGLTDCQQATWRLLPRLLSPSAASRHITESHSLPKPPVVTRRRASTASSSWRNRRPSSRSPARRNECERPRPHGRG
jgi:hypothetical protein